MPTFDESDEEALMHYGILRRSGRYPWGSGGNHGTGPNATASERAETFRKQVARLKAPPYSYSEKQISEALGFDSIKQLRNTITIANNAIKSDQITQIRRLRDKGITNRSTIAEMVFGDKSKESLVRSLEQESVQLKAERLAKAADILRDRVEEAGFVDVGRGQEIYLGVPARVRDSALTILKDEGYQVHDVAAPGASGRNTITKVLTKEDWKTTMQNTDKISPVRPFDVDMDAKADKIQKPISVDPSRLQVVYGNVGAKSDGVIFVRPGVPDLDMGANTYAQARIQVGPKHYLKGMAVIKKDLPPGVDMQFHTNKKDSGNKLDALKELKIDKLTGKVDADLPFGSMISRQLHDSKGKVKSAINIVNEDDNWDSWAKTLSSQMLSKQRPDFVKSQLDVTYANKKAALDEIKALTNPAVKRKLLESFSDDLDSSAVHMKAASLPGQETKVILPINSLKPTEVYAPSFRDGERVALIRYPHGGLHEIPELVVNNRNKQGRDLIGADSKAAIGIHYTVANKLSGADFDGDTVVVIPNSSRRLATSSTNLGGKRGTSKDDGPLGRLKEFDTKDAYGPERFAGVPYRRMTKQQTQTQMGMVSNLITDMTIKGASDEELARAVKHSMVVIDAEKHGLNYQQSYKDHSIQALKSKYQGSARGGASTIVSVSTGDVKVPEVRKARANEGGAIDPVTGKINYVPSGKTYNRKITDKDGNVVGYEKALSRQNVAKGALVDDAYDLIKGGKQNATLVEKHYADYSNSVRQLANEARLEMLRTPKLERSPSAARVYKKEVESLNAKLELVQRKAPVERQAQRIALSMVKAKREANPDLTKDEIKKVTGQALRQTRARLGLTKLDIQFSDREWEAIQAGAVSESKLSSILAKADMNQVRELATPRIRTGISAAQKNRAKALLNNKYTLQEVADELGISVSKLKSGLE